MSAWMAVLLAAGFWGALTVGGAIAGFLNPDTPHDQVLKIAGREAALVVAVVAAFVIVASAVLIGFTNC